MLLADRDATTAGDLAADPGVSVRTRQRDLAALRELGVPIDSDRGRGGGIRPERGWSLGRVHLNESEALGLLLSLAIAEKTGLVVTAVLGPGGTQMAGPIARYRSPDTAVNQALLDVQSRPPPQWTR